MLDLTGNDWLVKENDELLNLAFAEQRILLTEDKDFGELVYRLRKPAYAISW